MTTTATVGTPARKACRRLEATGEQLLLPGIPNDITLDKIVPKLRWKHFLVLKVVSRRWCDAIRSRQVYEARVRAQTIEKDHILCDYYHFGSSDRCKGIALSSIKENISYQLPPIPNVVGGIPVHCQCVSLDGKIYVLGGSVESPSRGSITTNNVYVLDMVGLRPWQECASMLGPREEFGCGVLDGKIYVFGGFSCTGMTELAGEPEEFVRGSEVYDPKQNTWTPIMPMQSLRFAHHVGIHGEELVLHSGKIWHREYPDMAEPENLKGALQFYHPVKNEWRFVRQSRMPHGVGFMTRGKLHVLSGNAIHVYDADTNFWRKLHSCSFPAFGPIHSSTAQPLNVVAIDDELFALVDVYDDGFIRTVQHVLVRSKGLGSKRKRKIVWRQIELEFADWPQVEACYSLNPIQL